MCLVCSPHRYQMGYWGRKAVAVWSVVTCEAISNTKIQNTGKTLWMDVIESSHHEELSLLP